MTTTPEHDARVAALTFAEVYPHYVTKVEKKGRTEAELRKVIGWLTGYKTRDLQRSIGRTGLAVAGLLTVVGLLWWSQTEEQRLLRDVRSARQQAEVAAASGNYETAHPMILQMGEHFILCSDFRDGSGTSVNVDFYVARQDDAFVVFDTVVDDREPIQRLMRAGLVQPIN